MALQTNSKPVIHIWRQDNKWLGCRHVQCRTSYLILYGEVDEISIYQNLVRWSKCSIMFEKKCCWYVGSEFEHEKIQVSKFGLRRKGKTEKVLIITFHKRNFLIRYPCIKHRGHFNRRGLLKSLHRLFHFSTYIHFKVLPILLREHHQLMGGFSVAVFSAEDGT